MAAGKNDTYLECCSISFSIEKVYISSESVTTPIESSVVTALADIIEGEVIVLHVRSISTRF